MADNVQTVLVVLLGIGFTVLLIMGIVLVFIIIKIMSNIRRLTQRMDETSENLGEVGKYLGRKIAPAAVSAIIAALMRKAKSSIKRDRK